MKPIKCKVDTVTIKKAREDLPSYFEITLSGICPEDATKETALSLLSDLEVKYIIVKDTDNGDCNGDKVKKNIIKVNVEDYDNIIIAHSVQEIVKSLNRYIAGVGELDIQEHVDALKEYRDTVPAVTSKSTEVDYDEFIKGIDDRYKDDDKLFDAAGGCNGDVVEEITDYADCSNSVDIPDVLDSSSRYKTLSQFSLTIPASELSSYSLGTDVSIGNKYIGEVTRRTKIDDYTYKIEGDGLKEGQLVYIGKDGIIMGVK